LSLGPSRERYRWMGKRPPSVLYRFNAAEGSVNHRSMEYGATGAALQEGVLGEASPSANSLQKPHVYK
jgi:hypothetical protein